MKLPELSEGAAPEFSDAATCKAWLENVPLANVAAAQGELLTQLQEFNRFPSAAAPRLAVMEALREAVHFVQIEQAKRFTNRALPMQQAEAEPTLRLIAPGGIEPNEAEIKANPRARSARLRVAERTDAPLEAAA